MTEELKNKTGDKQIFQQIETPPPILQGAAKIITKARQLLLDMDKNNNNISEEYKKLHSLLTININGVLSWNEAAYFDQKLLDQIDSFINPPPPPPPEVYEAQVKLATKDRGDIYKIEDTPTTQEASKKFFQEERDKLAKELKEARKNIRESANKISQDLNNIESIGEKDVAKRYESNSEAVSNQANDIKEILDSNVDRSLEGYKQDKDTINQHIDNSSLLKKLKLKLTDFFNMSNERLTADKRDVEKADNEESKASAEQDKENDLDTMILKQQLEEAKKKLKIHYNKSKQKAEREYSLIYKSVEQTTLRNNAFFVHTIAINEVQRHNANSNITEHATISEDLDMLLALEPSISTSSVMTGANNGLWTEEIGVILSGGDIGEFGCSDIGTTTRGIKGRGKNEIADKRDIGKLDELVSDRYRKGYNELVVHNPEVFGFYVRADIDDNGDFGSNINFEQSKNYIDMATKKGLMPLIMTKDRKVFEFKSIDSLGKIQVGREILPEEVAKGKAGLTVEKRKKIGQAIVFEKLLRNASDIKEAKAIISQLSGEPVRDLTTEEYIKYLQYNPALFHQLPEKLLADKQFMLDNCYLDPVVAYRYASKSLRKDEDFIKKLISCPSEWNTNVYDELPIELKMNRDILIWALDNPTFHPRIIDYSFIEDREIMERITNKEVDFLQLKDISDSPEGKWLWNIGYSISKKETVDINIGTKMLEDYDFLGKLQKKYPQYSFNTEKYEDGGFSLHYKQK